jgi:hypothetical protein
MATSAAFALLGWPQATAAALFEVVLEDDVVQHRYEAAAFAMQDLGRNRNQDVGRLHGGVQQLPERLPPTFEYLISQP